jgi:N6-adenosine-specific RNA methylase IME4
MKIQLRDSKKDVTPTAIVKILEDEAKAARRRAAYEAGLRDGCTVADLEALAASGFRAGAILADPPWAFETYSDKGEGRSPEYKTMSVAEIAALPVDALAAADCVLCLWSVWHDLPGALRVIAAWGFTIKTGGFVWVKQNPSGEGLFMSKGYWTRPNSELCLLATRGNPLRLNADVHQVVLSPVGKHSVKPDCVHERIERLAPGPYLELFGRRLHPHWTVWGDEIPRDALAESGGGLEVHQEAAE